MVGIGWPPGSATPGEQPGGTQGSGTERWDRWGCGERDPHTGLYEWYEVPPEERPEAGERVAWSDILSHWRLIEADFQEHYGIDLDDRALWRTRTWRWLETRITGLLAADTRLYRALAPEPDLPDLPTR